MHSTSRHPFVCNDVETFTTVATLLHTVARVWHLLLQFVNLAFIISSTKHSTAICRLAHSQKCIFMQNVLCYDIVCIIQNVPGVKVNTLGLNSRPNSESKMSYTHRSDSQRLVNQEQLKCSGGVQA